MKLNPFAKNKEVKKPKKPSAVQVVSEPATEHPQSTEAGDRLSVPASDQSVLEGFFVSEKASQLAAMGQYVFRVAPEANKSEIKKTVSRMFGVKVRDVKIVKLPSKHRAVGRYVGTKSGFKKAIVVLEPGQTISQAGA